jgi:hypothetical protein
MPKNPESALEQVKREHPNLPRAAQKAIARAMALLKQSKQLGNWSLEYFAKAGAQGGRIRAKKLTAKRRKQIARKAARARWKRRR